MDFFEAPYKQAKPEQLSESPVNDDIDLLQTKIDALEVEMLSDETMSRLPDWWYEKPVPGDLEHKLENPADIARFIEIKTRFQRLDERLYANYDTQNVRPVSEASRFSSATYGLSPEQISQVVISEPENGPVRQTILTALASEPSEKMLEIVQHTFGLEKTTQLFALKGAPYAELVRKEMRNPKVIAAMQTALFSFDEASALGSEKVRKTLVEQILVNSYGLSETDVTDYAFSTIHGYGDEMVIDLVARLDHFGIERLRAMTKATGIIGIESYSIEQLERMERLITEPEEMSEELRERDVSVLFVNRYDSDNSLMREWAKTFDDTNGSGRTLFFEIANPADIYRAFVQLQKAGIKPATVAIAAHGSAGGFVISDDRNPEVKKDRWLVTDGKRVTEAKNTSFAETGRNRIDAPMHDMSGLARVVENYMQPSRGVDDDPQDEGRKKIILVTCQMAAETPQYDLDDEGNKVQIGNESVVSQLGKELAASGVQSSVDIYGAVESIQVFPTDRGVRFATSPETWGGERGKADATRFRLESGQFSSDVVAEIPLRK